MPRSNPLMQSSPGSLAPEAPDFHEQLTKFQDAFGRDGPIGTLPFLPQSSAYEMEKAKREREAKTTTGDYVGAVVRQDSPVDGMVAAYVGSQMLPDPTYNAADKQTYEANTLGLPEEYHNEMLKAVSGAHAVYLRERLDQKLSDMQKLGDLGVPGSIARFLGGLVEPTNLALGLVSGGATHLARGSVALKAAAGLGTGAASGYTFERWRQHYTFEDSQADAAWAGLMGLAFSAPFVGLHAGEMARVRKAATKELEALHSAPGTDLVAMHKEATRDFMADPFQWENGPVEKHTLPDPTPHPERLLENFSGETPHADAPPPAPDTPPAEGFLPGSVGGAQVEQVPVDLTAHSKWRFDIFARLNKSENPIVQRLGKMFVKDAITSSDFYAQGRTVSEDKKLLQRRIGGGFHFEAASAYKEFAQKMGLGFVDSNLPKNVNAFYQDVGRYIRDPAAYAGHAGVAEIARAATAYRKVMSEMLDEMKKAGVKGADNLAANPDYLNRVWKQSKIRELSTLHGADEVAALVGKSVRDRAGILQRFRDDNPQSTLTDDQVMQNSASRFLNAVMKLEHSHLSNELLLTAHDAPTLRSELGKANLKPGEVEEIINSLFEHQATTSGDAGAAPNLKYRFNLDEGTAHVTAKGETIRLADLFENDARFLADRYMNSMAGHVAMARQGVKSRADFDALLREADADHSTQAATRDPLKFKEEQQMLEDVYNHIVGRPMSVHSFGALDRIASTLRAYSRSAYLGQLGFTAMTEAFHAAGLMTWRAAVQQMPSLREFWQSARAGHAPTKGLAEDVRQMLGYLNEHVSGYLRQHEVTDFTYDAGLNRFENAGNALSHATDKLSGNSFMTSLTRGMAAGGMIQKYANFARGTTKLTAEWRKRIVGAGVHESDIDHMLEQLKQHVDMEGNRVSGVRWEEWSAKDPNSYHDFLTAVDRDVRQGVQDHDIGETWMQQHTSLGKVFTELRAFNIAGHSKQFLNGLHYRDRTSLQLWNTSIIVNSLAYITQTSMNYGHNPKELEKRLTAQRIAQAAYQRSSMMGLLPFFTDTLVPGAVPFVHPQSGTTANTDSRNILMPPSFNLVAKGVNFIQNGNPKDGLSILPFSNTYGARNLVDMIGKAYPQSTPHQ
jgi:hypothetical protein